MTFRRLLLVYLAIGCSWLATSPARAARLPGWAKEIAQEPLYERYENEDAVVLLEEWSIQLDRGSRTGRHRRLVRILTEDGVEHAVLTLARGAFDRFSKLKVWVRAASGKTTRYGEDEGLLLGAASQKILDETEVLVVHPAGLAPGGVVAVEYDWASTPDIPQDAFWIQEGAPVVLTRIDLRLGEGWQALARVSSEDGLESKVVSDQHTWEFANVPAVRESEQPGAPKTQRKRIVIDYAPAGEGYRFDDWNSTAQWVVDLFDLERGREPLLSSKVADLSGSDGDLVDRVTSLVRDIRYFSIAIGWGGYRPRAPETTLERGFGDCKDKSLLMVALLRELDIEASPVLTSSPEDLHVDPGLSGPRQFNHCVVGIPWLGQERRPGMAIVDDPAVGPVRIIDPTLPGDSGQDIPIRLEGAPGLVANLRTTELLRFPTSGSGENSRTIQTTWNLDSSDGAMIETRRRLRGALRAGLLDDDHRILTAEELREHEYGALSLVFPGFEDLEIDGPETPLDSDWSYGVTLRHPAPMYEYEDLRVLRPRSLMDVRALKLPDEEEQEEVHLPFLATFRTVDVVRLEGQRAVRLPDDFTTENTVGRVMVDTESDGDRISVTRELQIVKAKVSPDQRDEVMELRSALRRANRGVVVLTAAGQPPY